ncbi:protein-glutamate methylesterase/protein-glutamine glutaminase [Marinomonas ostreistagni]|uniref:protein-glutamate methylesterase/protein-glutamine glutaminase n=1 Tax=Marinomonas ostreistagni TaxID=359209 RepID=UPI0019521BB8|nr:chemotaxis response regulator protein-glutamate methylesterase [Marinomonas ostreistagni]MBM6551744.1 chemotaxis response regulator protein-glutamate methylesterase [Marinomonas ostreistagni]
MVSKLIKVLIVDDSELIRRILQQIISEDPQLHVVATARDAFEAKEMVRELKPDVITLDVEMPKVDGLRFLEVLMKAQPTPVVMISTLTRANADVTLRALELGAVDYIPKPTADEQALLQHYASTVIQKVKQAAKSRSFTPVPTAKKAANASELSSNRVLAIGASTGGTEAIRSVLQQLPAQHFAVVMTQHMPAGFTTTYAARLDSTTDFKVIEAKGGELVQPGYAYLAPGDFHLRVVRKGNQLYTDVFEAEKVSGHRPSVDVLFESIAKEVGKHALATLLTGMGRDGAKGLKKIHDQGAYTVAQDEESCVVFGMPREAIELGAATKVAALDRIGATLIDAAKR